VCLGPGELDLPGFLAVAGRLADGVLYLRAVPSGQRRGSARRRAAQFITVLAWSVNDRPQSPAAARKRESGRGRPAAGEAPLPEHV